MNSQFSFEKIANDHATRARAGRITTAHGSIDTPAFMPVGTQGTVKALTQQMLEDAGASIILGNTYHLYLRPGRSIINQLGGLHRFMAWDRPILTDSGGVLIFRLTSLLKVEEERGEVYSPSVDFTHFLSPARAIDRPTARRLEVLMCAD